MTSKTTADKLATLGFEFDEDVTFKDPTWTYWHGTIDPIGRRRVAGDNVCTGRVVGGVTRADMDREALAYAAEAFPMLVPCTDSDCDMHGECRAA